MATKITLQPNPSFKHTVYLPVAGNDAPEALELIFKHMTRSAIRDIYEQGITEKYGEGAAGEVKFFMDMVSGWDIAADFTAENVTAFLENYAGAGEFIFHAYMDEITKARLGN